MKSKLEIYALAVCFVAVVCLAISLSGAGYAIIRIADPELTVDTYTIAKYQTNDRYWESKQSCLKDPGTVKKPSDDELTKQRVESLSLEIRQEKRNGFQTFIHAFIFGAVGTIALLSHWHIAKKARALNA